MSAPDSDPDKQAYQHRGPLRGMFAVVLFAAVLLGALAIWVFVRSGDPQGTEAQVEGSTGDVELDDAGGPTANVEANDDPAVGEVEADPTAVTVAPETVTAPDVGAGNPPDTDPGESQAAEPLEPAGEGAGAAEEEPATE